MVLRYSYHKRVEAERQRTESSLLNTVRSQVEGKGFDGADDFIAAIDTAPQASQALLLQLSRWAMDLEQAKLVKLTTYHGKNGVLTLLPRLVADNGGLVSIYNNKGIASLQFWRSVFECRAPNSLAHIEASIMSIKQAKKIREVSDELLDVLTKAYQEAVGSPINIEAAEV